MKILRLVSTLLVVLIVGQTLFFKFTAAPESVEIFTRLGLEPHGRIGIGIAELVAIVLLLVPRAAVFGAALAAALMAGALFAHATRLGFAGDMGVLAGMGAVALAASLVLLWTRRRELPVVGAWFGPAAS
jgi:uncharacterized membrane protein YphA (DoxX/SURF4 family)